MKDIVSLPKEFGFGKELGFIHEGLITLRKAGMTRALWTRLTESEELARRVVNYIKYGHETTSQKRAEEIMGRQSFLPVREVVEHYDLYGLFLKEEEKKIPPILFGEKTLEKCRDTHVLFLDFSKERGLSWYLMKKKIITENLKGGWTPYLQLGEHQLPLGLFLAPRCRSEV